MRKCMIAALQVFLCSFIKLSKLRSVLFFININITGLAIAIMSIFYRPSSLVVHRCPVLEFCKKKTSGKERRSLFIHRLYFQLQIHQHYLAVLQLPGNEQFLL